MYTATKLTPGRTGGQAFQGVRYTDGVDTFEESYRTPVITPNWPETIIATRLLELNALDLSVLTTGAPKPLPTPIDSAPTQEELDRDAFLLKLRDWQQKQAILASGVSKAITQADVDSALASWKASYKDEYAQFLVGRI